MPDDPLLSRLASVVDLDASASSPLYHQLYNELKETITERFLSPGARLPSTRDLADTLGISRNTVIAAFEELKSEGYLESRVGAGTFVCDELPEHTTRVSSTSSPRAGTSLQLTDTRSRSPSLSNNAQQVCETNFIALDTPAPQTAFRQGLPALDAFPIDVWAKLASRRWRFLPTEELVYGAPAGYAPLRSAVARYLRTSRGVRCEADQVLIVSGIQQAITLTARVLLDSGDAVYVEDPGFPRMRTAFTAAGADLNYAPVDNEGITLSPLQSAPSTQVVGVTPSHQYPTGVTMSMERRLALLEWAHEHEAWILEDDYDGQFRYSGEPLAALQGLDNSGRVLYTGTFSKILFPGLRLGYLVVPPDLVDPFVRMRSTVDRCPPRTNQMILTDFITEGHFERHIRKMRVLYANRQDTLLDAIRTELGDVIDISGSNAGLHLVGRLPKGVDDAAVSSHLDEHGIIALPLSFYSKHPLSRGGLLLGYGCVSEDEIREGVQRMADALQSYLPPS
ncbi:MAG: PLP-dependent aminotransferase family protein [Salinivenus sp.]